MGSKKTQPQLYELFKELSFYEPHATEQGRIIGHAILAGLNNFSTATKDPNELKFQEVRAVYAALGDAIKIAQDADAYTALCELQGRIKKNGESQSPLFHYIVEQLNVGSGAYKDRLRRKSMNLLEEVDQRGPLHRTIDILLMDYAAIEGVFK